MPLHCNQLPAVPPSSESGKSNLFRNLFTLFVIPATASGLFLGARPAEAQNAYITDNAGVSVINTATNKVTTTITAGVDHSTGVAVTTDGSKV